ncbi:pyroglutamyl-peptidase I [Ruegeria lacuscaerulensis]|uniref:pyroglutamyl-peptidase I n=1 Tax=Ruegeria lacuscaerulensis TaxID=55218 RepID=UPI00147F81D1|nr:pyroglutamyl-peptidase I [Ruegeria lacuscaerulensis]
MQTVLLTGFEAYGTTPINPAEQVAKLLDGETVGGSRLVSKIVPNTFFKCIDFVQDAITEVQPDAVVMMGEYGGRSMITVERIAQNLNDDARYGLKDNDGVVLQDVLTAPDGPAAYRTTLPIRAMVRAMRDAGIPSDISDAAGTFCCNHLMYGVLHYLAENNLDIRAGWVHLPTLPGVAALDRNLGTPSMSKETAAAGIRAAITAITANPQDTKETIASRLQI